MGARADRIRRGGRLRTSRGYRAFAEDEVTVEALLARADDRERLLRRLVEREALDRLHRPLAAGGGVDLALYEHLHGRRLVRVLGHRHAKRGRGHVVVEREDRE